MQFTRKEMKQIGIGILRTLGVSDFNIEKFEKENVIPYFDNGMLDTLAFVEVLSSQRLKIAEEAGGKCYAVVYSHVQGFPMLSYLCVSPYMEDTEYMCQQIGLAQYRVYAYCVNLIRPELSEYGSIIVECSANGIVKRVF